MQPGEALFHTVVLMLTAAFLCNERALPCAAHEEIESGHPEESKEDDADTELDDDNFVPPRLGSPIRNWMNFLFCKPGKVRDIELTAVGESIEFMCPSPSPLLDPPLSSGKVYTSVRGDKAVNITENYPEVHFVGSPDMGYRITLLSFAHTPKTLSFRCRSRPRCRRSKNSKVGQPSAASESPTPTRAPASWSGQAPGDERPLSCAFLFSIPGRTSKPASKKGVDPLVAKAVRETTLLEKTRGEDQPLKVCVGDSITLYGDVNKNLLFACAADQQYLSPKRSELAFTVRKGVCQYGNPRVLSDFAPNSFRLESLGGAQGGSQLMKQRKRRLQTEETENRSSRIHTGDDADEDSPTEEDDDTPPQTETLETEAHETEETEAGAQEAEPHKTEAHKAEVHKTEAHKAAVREVEASVKVSISTVYKFVLTELPRSPAKLCYQCKAQPGRYGKMGPPPDCTIFIDISAKSSAHLRAAPPSFAGWRSIVPLLAVGWCVGS